MKPKIEELKFQTNIQKASFKNYQRGSGKQMNEVVI
jgi:hypothetical protein